MKRSKWLIYLGLAMIFLTVAVYLIHYAIFRDAHHIFIYLIGDIAFVFFEVFLVTIIIHELLQLREKQTLMEKLNMVIGAFFSEVGSDLLRLFSQLDPQARELNEKLLVRDDWSGKVFDQLRQELKGYGYAIQLEEESLPALKEILLAKREFLLRLLENPNILEHDKFTNLLQAVFHLTEELAARRDLSHLTPGDRDHIVIDIKRVYHSLTMEWLIYMKYLKASYPFLFSFSLRTNPFNPEATAELP
ncbi:MAG: hypothetical protein U1C55_01450 [Smithellaceae bacterium]|nr:hypothetical protein [Smithellaceae bacterium]